MRLKGKPEIGEAGELTFSVEPEHAIDFADDDRIQAVLGTPRLIWFLEHARSVILPLLDNGESTLGTRVEVRHLAARPVGRVDRCRARVVQTHAREVLFQLEARDEHEVT
jgi:fluoroacetyl-CoA thioesterase